MSINVSFFSPFSIAITSLGEERANLSAFRTFVRFVLVWICRFPLPLGVWEGLRFVNVALPGFLSYLFFIFEWAVLLDTELLSLRYAVFLVFLFKELLDFFIILIKPVLVFARYWSKGLDSAWRHSIFLALS